jgi:hypothetical protein
MDTNTNWIKNLDAIDNCKQDIRTALERKGVDMTDVAFASYAEKINALQLESGDSDTPSEPSTPTPSAEYIYSNGYVEGGTPDIMTYVPYKIELDEENKFSIELFGPKEIPVFTPPYYDIIFTFDVPEEYDINHVTLEKYNTIGKTYFTIDHDYNPSHSKIIRDGITYNSYVRRMEYYDGNENEVSSKDGALYRITIYKQ